MKRFFVVFLVLTVAFFVLLHYSAWWSLAAIGAGMLFSVYHFYMTRLKGMQYRTIHLEKEVEELHLQLDSSISKEQKAYKEAERAKDVKRRLLATVNHEIRTPMNGMLGMTSLLVETPLSTDQREYVDTIRFCGESLLVAVNDILVSDILNFSKSEREGEELEKKDFEIRNCIKEVLMMFAGRIAPGGPDLAYCMEAQVPEQVNGDRKRVSQILMNLVENAVRYTTKGEILITVRSIMDTPADAHSFGSIGLAFEVKDSGSGIPENKIGQLFKGITSQEPLNAGAAPGGLGLVVCKKLAGLMGGTITVESQLNRGSTFTCRLYFSPALKPKYSPLNPGFSDAGKKIKLTGATGVADPARRLSEEFAKEFPLRILVAEDNAINQKLTMKVLGKLGYKAGLAENGKEVLEMADLEQYDVILMDVQMPVMDGLEATRMLRLCLKKQPVIIAMTANAMEGDQDDCIQAGMDDYISKPVEINALLTRLEKWGTAINAKRSGRIEPA
ncbi:response regulator [Flavitalea sp. BT771]|uniref:response regulator n=1 Tax=Flavitalea sp. BT771 TaxID=3063329 RepID=UPI0026E24569|nr:response regulator [Flavitalea sp. BT771]MDO6430418.1 response regulator [Flavitalea sp. BT771]MDV6219442.1 response regulator [Flavitalea sp. BT771]